MSRNTKNTRSIPIIAVNINTGAMLKFKTKLECADHFNSISRTTLHYKINNSELIDNEWILDEYYDWIDILKYKNIIKNG